MNSSGLRQIVKMFTFKEIVTFYLSVYMIIATVLQYLLFNIFDKADSIAILLLIFVLPASVLGDYVGGCTGGELGQERCTYIFNMVIIFSLIIMNLISRIVRAFLSKSGR